MHRTTAADGPGVRTNTMTTAVLTAVAAAGESGVTVTELRRRLGVRPERLRRTVRELIHARALATSLEVRPEAGRISARQVVLRVEG